MTASKPLPVILLALITLPIGAQDSLKCSAKELLGRIFPCQGLSLTIRELNGYKVFDRERKFSGRARVILSIENKGSQFQQYSPQELSFVGADGLQVFPIFERNLADDTMPMSFRVAPGAHFSVEYALTGRLTFPAKFFVGSTLAAEISE